MTNQEKLEQLASRFEASAAGFVSSGAGSSGGPAWQLLSNTFVDLAKEIRDHLRAKDAKPTISREIWTIRRLR